ncbi:MAG TPA: hypothetical protein VK660_10775 [Xanthomonadaceae bacterium]|jgi:hypothetical protein|nr:hypothetical protein [Xanthomonadaceae bacterium]
MNHPTRRALFVFGAIWASPNTLLGLLLGLPALPFGARLSISDGALTFLRYPWGPGTALALGNVILCTQATLDGTCSSYAQRYGLCPPGGALHRLGDHERAHVYQAMALGVFFLPLYFLYGGISARNRFEQAADRYAETGSGWWPWSA